MIFIGFVRDFITFASEADQDWQIYFRKKTYEHQSAAKPPYPAD
jgi:hypothetical protein